jgi:hypothetical protein
LIDNLKDLLKDIESDEIAFSYKVRLVLLRNCTPEKLLFRTIFAGGGEVPGATPLALIGLVTKTHP